MNVFFASIEKNNIRMQDPPARVRRRAERTLHGPVIVKTPGRILLPGAHSNNILLSLFRIAVRGQDLIDLPAGVFNRSAVIDHDVHVSAEGLFAELALEDIVDLTVCLAKQCVRYRVIKHCL